MLASPCMGGTVLLSPWSRRGSLPFTLKTGSQEANLFEHWRHSRETSPFAPVASDGFCTRPGPMVLSGLSQSRCVDHKKAHFLA